MPKPLISVGQLIDESFNVYKTRITELLGVSGWILVTAILYVIALAFYPSSSALTLRSDLTGGEMFGIGLYALTAYLIAPILTFWIYTSLTRMVKTHLSRKRPDHKMALKEGKEVLIPAAITTFMVLLMLLLAIVIGFAPPAIIAGIGAWLNVSGLVLIGNLLLVLGIFVALYLSFQWMVYYFFAPIITILEKTPSKKALEASRKLVRGKFWQALIRIVVPKLVFIAFGLFVMVIVGYIGNVLVDASAGISLDLQLRIATMTDAVLPTLIVIFINPLIIISDVLLYQSIKDA
ncbi:hypothetical protein HOI18_04315 [Candidatus Uhrbacteria bacterium]|jgi:hypothetical protein|nr:hypothetical protein [Candidatus Uhrbacteria bacterium]